MTPKPSNPTARQLRYLRDLACARGVTYLMPQTRAEASTGSPGSSARHARARSKRRSTFKRFGNLRARDCMVRQSKTTSLRATVRQRVGPADSQSERLAHILAHTAHNLHKQAEK